MNKFFASDNYSGVHPKIMDALLKANEGHAFAYGMDEYTKQAEEEFRKIFGDVEIYFVSNGTGANVLAMEAMKGRVTSIIAPETAHIFTDEAGAPTKITGVQILPVKSSDGKLDIEEAKKYFSFKNTFHRASPNAVSITQATELGTIYTLSEIREISKFAKENKMYLHMDGARIANAAVYLGCSLKEMTGDLGVDILSFGGIKNGLMYGEAIVFFNKKLAENFLALRKQNLQLNSKMRYISAQYIEYLSTNLWYENAKNSNHMAKYFAQELEKIEVEVINEVNGNTIIAVLPAEIIPIMQEFCYFYIWDEPKNHVRFVTSFDTTKEDIDRFIKKLIEVLG
ncbi:MAG: threonine aldolase family protein [Fusobacteriaceae bacterium]